MPTVTEAISTLLVPTEGAGVLILQGLALLYRIADTSMQWCHVLHGKLSKGRVLMVPPTQCDALGEGVGSLGERERF